MFRDWLLGTAARRVFAPDKGGAEAAGGAGGAASGEGEQGGEDAGKEANFDPGKAKAGKGLMAGVEDGEEGEEEDGEEGKGEGKEDGETEDDKKPWQAPEDVPEHLRGEDPETTIKNILKAYNGARKELSKKGKVPEKPDDYKIELAEDDPDKEFFEGEENEPVVGMFRSIAAEHNLTQEQFAGVAKSFIEKAKALGLGPVDFDPAKEMEILGGEEKAKPIMRMIKQWGSSLEKQGILSAAEREEFDIMAGTGLGVKVMTKLRELTGEKTIPVHAQDADGPQSEAELRQMVADPRYEKDEAFRRKVDKAFEKFYGNEPAMSGPRGL